MISINSSDDRNFALVVQMHIFSVTVNKFHVDKSDSEGFGFTWVVLLQDELSSAGATMSSYEGDLNSIGPLKRDENGLQTQLRQAEVRTCFFCLVLNQHAS